MVQHITSVIQEYKKDSTRCRKSPKFFFLIRFDFIDIIIALK